MTPREEGHCWLAESRDEVILNPGPSSQFGVTLSVTISKEQMNALAFRVPIYLVSPQCILCRKQCAQIGCCTACGSILQYTSWHASWTTLTTILCTVEVVSHWLGSCENTSRWWHIDRLQWVNVQSAMLFWISMSQLSAYCIQQYALCEDGRSMRKRKSGQFETQSLCPLRLSLSCWRTELMRNSFPTYINQWYALQHDPTGQIPNPWNFISS